MKINTMNEELRTSLYLYRYYLLIVHNLVGRPTYTQQSNIRQLYKLRMKTYTRDNFKHMFPEIVLKCCTNCEGICCKSIRWLTLHIAFILNIFNIGNYIHQRILTRISTKKLNQCTPTFRFHNRSSDTWVQTN